MSIAKIVFESFELRVPDKTEIEQLSNFFFTSLNENFSYFPEPARIYYGQAWEQTALTQRLSSKLGLLMCAWQDSEIVGLVSGTPAEGGVGTIIWLMVAKQFQNQGIGKKLLSYAKDFYLKTNAHKIKLTVQDSNAVKFYLREGFEQEAWHRKHWWELDCLAMAYFL